MPGIVHESVARKTPMKTKPKTKPARVQSLAPQNIDKFNWYYEYPRSIALVHETRTLDGGFVQTDQVRIPWRMLEQSYRRRQEPRKARP